MSKKLITDVDEWFDDLKIQIAYDTDASQMYFDDQVERVGNEDHLFIAIDQIDEDIDDLLDLYDVDYSSLSTFQTIFESAIDDKWWGDKIHDLVSFIWHFEINYDDFIKMVENVYPKSLIPLNEMIKDNDEDEVLEFLQRSLEKDRKFFLSVEEEMLKDHRIVDMISEIIANEINPYYNFSNINDIEDIMDYMGIEYKHKYQIISLAGHSQGDWTEIIVPISSNENEDREYYERIFYDSPISYFVDEIEYDYFYDVIEDQYEYDPSKINWIKVVKDNYELKNGITAKEIAIILEDEMPQYPEYR